MDPAPGDVLGSDYHVLRRIADGGMSVLYQAWRQDRRSPVVLKLLAARRRWDPTFGGALRAETAALYCVRHPNVVRALDHGDLADGSPYLVLEWMPGGTVADVLRARGALRPRAATLFAIAACRGLQAVHQAGLLHLDVKPANMLLDSQGRLKLADFGLVVEVNGSGRAARQTGVGTPGYFAPEQVASQPADARTDLYSLGVAYFEMLTGRLPFKAQTFLEAVRANAPLPAPCPRSVRPDVPDTCAAITRRAMAIEAGERFTDAGEMLAALEQSLAELRCS
jgi:serine/threonine-protein kinase